MGRKNETSFCQNVFFAGGVCVGREEASLRGREERRGPRLERRPWPRESFGLIGIVMCVSRCCDAREAHARCTDPEWMPGALSVGSASGGHCGKTSPGGVRVSRCLTRPSEPPREQQQNALPHWNKTTEGEEQGFVHGFGCWPEGKSSAPSLWPAHTRKPRKAVLSLQQGRNVAGCRNSERILSSLLREKAGWSSS